MKKLTYRQAEDMMLKAFEDQLNGVESDLARQVRESLLNQTSEPPKVIEIKLPILGPGWQQNPDPLDNKGPAGTVGASS